MSTAAARLRRLAAATAIAAASGGAIFLTPSVSASDRGAEGLSVDVRNKIRDPTAVVPSRTVQKSALIGASAVNPLDILVIGGGATGCGVALDAVTRGLRVGLVEREDFSSGTSSRSTKLIHGGMDAHGRNLYICRLSMRFVHGVSKHASLMQYVYSYLVAE